MIVDANIKSIVNLDIEYDEAFKVLCKTLHMEYVLDEEDFFIKKDKYGMNCVYRNYNDNKEYDDRGDLFIALRNLAVQLFPNLSFRGAAYIYR